MYVVKHYKIEQYFGKREMINGYFGDMVFTEDRNQAKVYPTLWEAINAVEWYQDENYIPTEK